MTLRRGALLAVLSTLVAAGAAFAGPLPGPLHESTSTVSVPSKVRAVVIDVNAGDVKVSVGKPQGSAHKRWTLSEPTLTSTFRAGTLRLEGRCGERQGTAGVYVGTTPVADCGVDLTLTLPAGVPVQVAGDRVSVTGLRGAVKVRALSSVALTRVGPGAVDAESSASTLALRSSNPSVTRLGANSSVSVTDVTTGALDAYSYSSTLSLARVTAKAITARANSSVSLSQVRAASAKVGSDSSTVSLSEVRAGGPVAVRANSSIGLDQVTANSASLTSDSSTVQVQTTHLSGGLVVWANSSIGLDRTTAATADLTSDSSTVKVSATRLTGRLVAFANSSIRVEDTTAPVGDLRSASSSLDVRTSPFTDLTGIANSSITVDLPVVPGRVKLESSSSSLTLHVPRSSYAVTARSGSGDVTVRGIVIDDQAPRYLDLTANSDVTVN